MIDASHGASGDAQGQRAVQGDRYPADGHAARDQQPPDPHELAHRAVGPPALAAADLGFIFQKQKTKNQLLVNDGETAVIGGLTVTEVNKTRSGIPLLSVCRSSASCSAPATE